MWNLSGLNIDDVHRCRNGIDLVLNCKVTSISDGSVQITYNDGNTVDYPFGACVWATGVAKHPLVTKLQERLPEDQTHFRSAIAGSKHVYYCSNIMSSFVNESACCWCLRLFMQ